MAPTFALLVLLYWTQPMAGWNGRFDDMDDLDFPDPYRMDFEFPDLYGRKVPPCNKKCSCSESKIDCKNKGLTVVPTLTGKRHYHTWIDEIDISHNRICRILGHQLQSWRPMSFTTIKLNNNRIVQIEASAAATMFYRSEHLSVATNLLTTFPWEELRSNSFLYSLNLKGNMLSSAPSNALQGLRLLKEFNIQNNRFTMLPKSFFRYNKQLQKAYFGGNPWKCDCDNNWLRLYMEEKEDVVQDERGILCDEPPNLARTPVKILPISTFACIPPTIHNVNHYPRELSLREGQAVFMKCNASGREPLTVQWQGPRRKSVTTHRFTDRVQVTGGNDALLLTVKHITMEDMPGYTCKASNKGGPVSIHVPLNISCTSSCPKRIPPKPTVLVTALKNITSNQATLTWTPGKSPKLHLAFAKVGQRKPNITVVKGSDARHTLLNLAADTTYTICISPTAPVYPTNCQSFKTKSADNGKGKPSGINRAAAIIGGTTGISLSFILFGVGCFLIKHCKNKSAAPALPQRPLWHTNRPMSSHRDYFTRPDMHARSQPSAPTERIHGQRRDLGQLDTYRLAHPVRGRMMEQRFKPNIPPNDLGHCQGDQDDLTPPPTGDIYEAACPVSRGNVPLPPVPTDTGSSGSPSEDIYGMAA